MNPEITYQVLEIYTKRIRELISDRKYRSADDFLKTAIEILLTWESEKPQECMDIMNGLRPFSPAQEAFLRQSMNPDEIKRQFGELEGDQDDEEKIQQEKLAQTDDDHSKVRENLKSVKKYIENLKISKPKNVISYNGYPLLSGFYSRILPAKIVLAVLCHLLEKNKDFKVELNKLRVYGYDIAEEFAEIMTDRENTNNIPRNRKTSTGLPKKGTEEKDKDKIAMAQKRFKDQFIGKIRKTRIEQERHFEGALAALNLIYAFEENGKTYVSLTEMGKKFYLLDNPILNNRYDDDSFSKQESDYIIKQLIPQRELEQKFVNTAISTIQSFHNKASKKRDGKITHILDEKIKQVAIKYIKENPESQEKYNLNHLEDGEESSERKITQWRLATMGRLSETKVVKWSINEKGDSEYSII